MELGHEHGTDLWRGVDAGQAVGPHPSTISKPEDAATASREQILALLHDSDVPMSIEDLCTATGLHGNTVRGHLEVLAAGGEVTRSRGATGAAAGRRGSTTRRIAVRLWWTNSGPPSALNWVPVTPPTRYS